MTSTAPPGRPSPPVGLDDTAPPYHPGPVIEPATSSALLLDRVVEEMYRRRAGLLVVASTLTVASLVAVGLRVSGQRDGVSATEDRIQVYVGTTATTRRPAPTTSWRLPPPIIGVEQGVDRPQDRATLPTRRPTDRTTATTAGVPTTGPTSTAAVSTEVTPTTSAPSTTPTSATGDGSSTTETTTGPGETEPDQTTVTTGPATTETTTDTVTTSTEPTTTTDPTTTTSQATTPTTGPAADG